MQLRKEYRSTPVRTPVSPMVHRAPPGVFWWQASVFDPPFPPREPGKGYPVWTLSHRGRELVFASPHEIIHVAEILGQRVLPRPWQLVGGGAENGRFNRHWLSRLHKSWTPWPVRQAAALVLAGSLRS